MLSSELPDAGLRPAAGDAAGRAADRLPRHQRQGRPDRRTTARIAARRCSSAATKKPACAASTTAGSSTSTATASTCRTSRPSPTSRPRSRPSPIRPRSAAASCGPTSARAQTPPPLPDLEGNMQPNAEQLVRATQLQSNWLQILEGDIDTTHVGFLHYGGLKAEDQIPGQLLGVPAARKDGALRGHRHRGRRGVRRAAHRPATDQVYWRIAQWCFPFYTFTPPGVLGTKKGGNARVPMDDYHTHDVLSMVSRSQRAGRRPNPIRSPDAAQHDRLVRPLPARAAAGQRLPDRSRGAAPEQRLDGLSRASAASPCRTRR